MIEDGNKPVQGACLLMDERPCVDMERRKVFRQLNLLQAGKDSKMAALQSKSRVLTQFLDSASPFLCFFLRHVSKKLLTLPNAVPHATNTIRREITAAMPPNFFKRSGRTNDRNPPIRIPLNSPKR